MSQEYAKSYDQLLDSEVRLGTAVLAVTATGATRQLTLTLAIRRAALDQARPQLNI